MRFFSCFHSSGACVSFHVFILLFERFGAPLLSPMFLVNGGGGGQTGFIFFFSLPLLHPLAFLHRCQLQILLMSPSNSKILPAKIPLPMGEGEKNASVASKNLSRARVTLVADTCRIPTLFFLLLQVKVSQVWTECKSLRAIENSPALQLRFMITLSSGAPGIVWFVFPTSPDGCERLNTCF